MSADVVNKPIFAHRKEPSAASRGSLAYVARGQISRYAKTPQVVNKRTLLYRIAYTAYFERVKDTAARIDA